MNKEIRQKLFFFSAVSAGVLFRIFFLNLSAYDLLYYDEAVSGLMTMDILKGKFTIFYWGAPYLGSLEAIIGSFFFLIFGISTHALRLSPFLAFIIFVYFTFKLGKKLNGNKIPFYLCFYLMIPPLALNEYTFSAMSVYMHTVAIGTVLLFVTDKMLSKNNGVSRFKDYILLGSLSGLGFWTFIMILPYIAACYLSLFIKERKKFFSFKLLCSGIAFFIFSSPFWIWNFQNSFLTFKMKASVAAFCSIKLNFLNFIDVIFSIMGNSNEFARVPFEPVLKIVISVLLIALSVFLIRNHFKRLIKSLYDSDVKPDLVSLLILCFFFIMASFVLSAHGKLTLSRYGLPLVSVLPLLLCYFFSQLSSRKKALHFIFIPLIIFLHFPHNAAFIQKNMPVKSMHDIQKLVRFLENNRIFHAYSHFTTAYSLTFESKQKIICADYNGFRNLKYLKQVDLASNTAIITDTFFNIPAPDQMKQQLKTICHGFKIKQIGIYTIFYEFEIFAKEYKSLNSQIQSISSNIHSENTLKMLDGNISTLWSTKRQQLKGDEILIEMKTMTALSKISLYPGTVPDFLPESMKIEISKDGKIWKTIKNINHIFDSFLSFNGHPKFFQTGQIDFLFQPELLKYIRMKLKKPGKENQWAIGEIYLYGSSEDKIFLNANDLNEFYLENKNKTIITNPELEALLLKISDGKAKTMFLYNSSQEFNSIYRTYDFQKHKLDFTNEMVFLISENQEDEITKFLMNKEISFEISSFKDFIVIKTSKIKNHLETIKRINITDWTYFEEEQKNIIEIEISEKFSITGIELISDDVENQPQDMKFQVFKQDQWKDLKARDLNNLYWSGFHLMTINSVQMAWHFSKPVMGTRIRMIRNYTPDLKYLGQMQIHLLTTGTVNASIKHEEKPLIPLKAEFGNKLMFKGISKSKGTLKSGEVLKMKYFFTPLKKLKNDFSVFVHFMTPDGKLLFQNDHDIQKRTVKTFKASQSIIDTKWLRIPENLKYNGKIEVFLGIWQPEKNYRFKVKSDLFQKNRSIRICEFDFR